MVNDGQEINGYVGIEGEDINYINPLTIDSEVSIVTIIDSGVNFDVSNIGFSQYINYEEIANNSIDDDGNGYIDDVSGWDFINNDNAQHDSSKDSNHGTSIVNILVGNDEGNYRPLVRGVKILALKVFEDDKYKISDIVEAIEYAERMGSKIVMMAFELLSYDDELYELMSNSNMFFICSAGNSRNTNLNYPARFDIDNMIVGGIDNNGYPSLTTNYGSDVVIYAPAENIYSINQDGDYEFYTGTSYAVPQVTSLAVYLNEVHNVETTVLKDEILLYSRVSSRAILGGNYLYILNLDTASNNK